MPQGNKLKILFVHEGGFLHVEFINFQIVLLILMTDSLWIVASNQIDLAVIGQNRPVVWVDVKIALNIDLLQPEAFLYVSIEKSIFVFAYILEAKFPVKNWLLILGFNVKRVLPAHGIHAEEFAGFIRIFWFISLLFIFALTHNQIVNFVGDILHKPQSSIVINFYVVLSFVLLKHQIIELFLLYQRLIRDIALINLLIQI